MTEPFGRLRRFLRELKRRNVYKVAVAYVAVAFVVLQGARLLVPALVLPEWFYRVVVALALLGFPLALVVAWAFEMTPAGVRRTEAAEEETAGGEVYQWIGLGLVVALAGGVWYATAGDSGSPSGTAATDTAQVAESSAPRLGDHSIAVLPFEALGQKQPGVFTEGMHDALLARLSNVSGIKVISRTAVEPYRDSEKATGEIARELGVRWILEGGVQEMGDQIQVNAQLIDPRTETHAWSGTYRRDLTAEKLFALQSDITKKIARSLEAKLSREEQDRVERRPTEDLDAYRLYVQGRNRLDTRTEAGMREAVEYFRRAIEQDSSYALAWSGLADAVALFSVEPGASLEGPLPDHERTARRALKLGPEVAEAHTSMGLVYRVQRNAPAALREYQRAVELKPSYAQAHHWLGWLLIDLGRLEDAHEHVSLAVELNPEHKAAREALIQILVAKGQVEQARKHLDEFPSSFRAAIDERLLVQYHAKQWAQLQESARKYLKQNEGSCPSCRFNLARVAALRGDTTTARKHLTELRKGEAESTDFYKGLVHAALGDPDQAFRALGQFDNVRWGIGRSIRYYFSDILDPLRDDPRYEELIQKINKAWGLNPDGSLPDSVAVSFEAQSDD